MYNKGIKYSLQLAEEGRIPEAISILETMPENPLALELRRQLKTSIKLNDFGLEFAMELIRKEQFEDAKIVLETMQYNPMAVELLDRVNYIVESRAFMKALEQNGTLDTIDEINRTLAVAAELDKNSRKSSENHSETQSISRDIGRFVGRFLKRLLG